MTKRILISTHLNSTGVPPQVLLVQQMLSREGYPTALIGKGKTGIGRLIDVAWRGPFEMLRSEVILVDVFGGRAFIYEALAIFYGKIFGRRVVAMLRGGWMPDFVKSWPWLSLWVLKRADHLVCPHAFLLERFKDSDLGINQTIPNFIDQEKYHYRERKPLRPRFLYLRGTHQIYNPEMCLRAFALVQSRYLNASLTIAGSGSTKSCEALAFELNLRNVSFVGLVSKDQVPILADQHDIYLQSNRVENMPVTILEMWASGLPVVGTSVGGMPYLVHHEENGLLVPSEDHEALASACCRLLEDKDDQRALTPKGSTRAKT